MAMYTGKNENYYVYTLSDPRDGRIRYVGVTHNTKARLFQHLSERNSSYRARWIHNLIAAGKKRMMAVVESGLGDRVDSERAWILGFLQSGCDLVNFTIGGECRPPGATGRKLSEQHKKRISESLRGNKFGLGYRHTSEARARISASLVGNRRGAGSFLGHRHSQETKAKMTLAQIGNKHFLGKSHSAEARARISATLKGHVISPDTRLKISQSLRAKHALCQ